MTKAINASPSLSEVSSISDLDNFSDKEVDTGGSDNADDSDYHPCQGSTSESDSDSANIPLACYVRQKDAKAPLSVITNQGENIKKEKKKKNH